jgi:large subunit ribosomal protein L13
MKTFSPKAGEINQKWLLVDADNKTLGRLAADIAHRLKGKHKPQYSPHMDVGDYIVVINVDKIKVTGNKASDKLYHRHTGYPGGLKSETFEKLQARRPERALELAIKGMLPKNPLGRAMFRKLKVYSGVNHPHEAQQPELINI